MFITNILRSNISTKTHGLTRFRVKYQLYRPKQPVPMAQAFDYIEWQDDPLLVT